MSRRNAALCAGLVGGILVACAVAPRPTMSSGFPPLRIEVTAHVIFDGTYDRSFIDRVPMVDICALKKNQFGSVAPAEVCERPYEVNWQVVIDDPAGKCAGTCSVELTRKGTPGKNKNLFASSNLTEGTNERAPDTWASYWGWGDERFSYALQLKRGGDLIGIKLDPDIMPHPPGG